MAQIKNLYQILGLSKDSTEDQIRQAFRSKSRQYHPDVSKEPNAESIFKDLEFAYSTLTDEVKRAKYDAMFTPPVESEGHVHKKPRSSTTDGNASSENTNAKTESVKSTNPFDLSDAYKKEMEEMFGSEWMRMYSGEMKKAAERYDKNSVEVDEMFKRVSSRTDEMMRRVNIKVEEMRRKI